MMSVRINKNLVWATMGFCIALSLIFIIFSPPKSVRLCNEHSNIDLRLILDDDGINGTKYIYLYEAEERMSLDELKRKGEYLQFRYSVDFPDLELKWLVDDIWIIYISGTLVKNALSDRSSIHAFEIVPFSDNSQRIERTHNYNLNKIEEHDCG